LEVLIYEDEFGYSAFSEWLKNIGDKSIRSKILTRLDRVKAGNFGDYKYLENGVFELRFMFGPGYRIYFGKVEERVIVLLQGGDKSSQKKDILKAIEMLHKYTKAKNEI
jgi:putative addiction module killer protein